MLMFVNGFIAGILATEIIIAIVVKCLDSGEKKEEFVKKLIEKEGWMGAQEVLNWSYNGKYMRTWQRLYRKHIEGEEE